MTDVAANVRVVSILESWRTEMLTTEAYDTKRGEDARMAHQRAVRNSQSGRVGVDAHQRTATLEDGRGSYSPVTQRVVGVVRFNESTSSVRRRA